MRVRLAKQEDARRWDEFVVSNPKASFLQSWEWGGMQESLNVPIWRFVVENENGWQAAILVIKRSLPLGMSWLYAPRGPVIKAKQAWPLLEKSMIKLASREKSIFLRVDPATTENSWLDEHWRKAGHEVQPKNTLITDITASTSDILSFMHSKTRYNIRLAGRKGVDIRFSNNAVDLDLFLKLAKDVSSRSDFNFHPEEYYRAMLDNLTSSCKPELAIAEYKGKFLAVHITIGYGDTVTYAHGASSSQNRNLMAPYLLQWETIKRAKEAGFKYYDWFGIAPKEADDRHAWSGITRFKTGFGGKRVEYLGAHDMIIRPVMYKGYDYVKNLRNKSGRGRT